MLPELLYFFRVSSIVGDRPKLKQVIRDLLEDAITPDLEHDLQGHIMNRVDSLLTSYNTVICKIFSDCS